MAHSFRRSVALTLFLMLAIWAAWGPRVTLREVLSSGVEAGQGMAASAEGGPAASPATMQTRAWTPMCQAMKERLRDTGIEPERKRELAHTFRNACL